MTKFLFGMATSAALFQALDVALVWSTAALLCFALWPSPKKESTHG